MNKTTNIFALLNIILSIPLWVGYFTASYQNEYFLVLISIWYINAFLLFIKHRFTSKLISAVTYIYLLTAFLGLFTYLDHNQFWSALFNIVTFIGAIVLFIQYLYVVALIGFVKSVTTNGSQSTKTA